MRAPYLQDPDVTLYHGDCRHVLPELAEESVHCVVTSPPYWRLRDYGVPGQLGHEASPDAYAYALVEVFRELRPVLRRDGTAWLVLGDTYAGSGKVTGGTSPRRAGPVPIPAGLKRKDLVGIPWRVALALQADGWWLRADVIWSKPNTMPESAEDRPTNAHEYVFLLTRAPSYHFDQEAVREPYVARAQQRLTPTEEQPLGRAREEAGVENGPQGGTHRSRFTVQAETLDGSEGEAPRGADGRRKTTVLGQSGSLQHRDGERWPHPEGRNVRSVWEIPAKPFPGAHFAVFPPELASRCIRAGCPEGGIVLDPFAGTGTTGWSARALGRRAVLIEVSAAYCAMTAERLSQLSLLAAP